MTETNLSPFRISQEVKKRITYFEILIPFGPTGNILWLISYSPFRFSLATVTLVAIIYYRTQQTPCK